MGRNLVSPVIPSVARDLHLQVPRYARDDKPLVDGQARRGVPADRAELRHQLVPELREAVYFGCRDRQAARPTKRCTAVSLLAIDQHLEMKVRPSGQSGVAHTSDLLLHLDARAGIDAVADGAQMTIP